MLVCCAMLLVLAGCATEQEKVYQAQQKLEALPQNLTMEEGVNRGMLDVSETLSKQSTKVNRFIYDMEHQTFAELWLIKQTEDGVQVGYYYYMPRSMQLGAEWYDTTPGGATIYTPYTTIVVCRGADNVESVYLAKYDGNGRSDTMENTTMIAPAASETMDSKTFEALVENGTITQYLLVYSYRV